MTDEEEEADIDLTKMMKDAIAKMDPHAPGAVSLSMPTFAVHVNVYGGLTTVIFNQEMAGKMVAEIQRQLGEDAVAGEGHQPGDDTSWADNLEDEVGN